MAIDTYAKLQTEILDTLERTDLVGDETEYTPGSIEGTVLEKSGVFPFHKRGRAINDDKRYYTHKQHYGFT